MDSERQITAQLHPQLAVRFDAACARAQLPHGVALEEAVLAWVLASERTTASEDGAHSKAS